MEEQGSKTIAAFDSLFTTNRIQMLKILLPRLHPRQQGGFAIYIKLLELQYAFSFLRLHPDIQLFGDVRPSAGFSQEEGEDTISLLDDLIPFSGPMEQARIQNMKSMIANFKKMKEMMSMIQMMQVRFSPSEDLENPYVFEQEVVGGAVPKNYYPAVEKGLQESVIKGPLAAYPVVGVKAVLYDGSYHPVDSSEQAFKMATIQAFKKGFLEAHPVLLEPIVSLKVTVPDAYTGDVMGDLNKRRGRVLGMNPIAGGKQVIEAEIPQSGLFGYCTDLRSMTGGRGDYAYQFIRYEQAPSDVQEKEVAARAASVAENNPED